MMRTCSVLASGVLAIAACSTEDETEPVASAEDPAAAGPISVVDASGTEIRLERPVERVVCLDGSCLDGLAEVGVIPVAANIPGMAFHEEFFGPDADIDVVGGSFFEPSIEDALAAEPDLIIGTNGVHSDLVPLATAVAPMYLHAIADLDDAVAFMTDVGVLSGSEDAAAQAGLPVVPCGPTGWRPGPAGRWRNGRLGMIDDSAGRAPARKARPQGFDAWRDVLTPHLVPAERILEYASRSLDDPETDAARDASYPWSMALANLVMLDELLAAMYAGTGWRGRCVLDAGCGPGLIARGVADFDADHVLAVDANPEMLAAARVLSDPVPNLEFTSGDLRALDVADSSVDVVVCGDVPLVDEIRAELWRVVRPGGAIVCKRTGIVPPCLTAWDPALDHAMRSAQAAGMAQAGPPWTARVPGWHLRELIEESGAPPVTFTTVVAQASAPLPELWRLYLQQRFATFDGPFIRAGANPETWSRVCELWRPGTPEYLFARHDAYVAVPVSVIVVHRR